MDRRSVIERFIVLALVIHVSPAFGEAFALSEAPLPVAPVAQNCNQPNVVDRGDSSPNKAHFENILKMANEGLLHSISLDSLLTLWYPKRGNGLNLSSPYFDCEAEEMGPFSDRSLGGGPAVPARCRPDVIYSWGPEKKSQRVLSKLSDNGYWSGAPNPGTESGVMYGSISAVSTFGFGAHLLRFKLKPSSRYGFRNHHGAVNRQITIRTDFFHDITVKNADLIESVATGTPEIYDEVVRDILRFQSGKRVSAYNKNDRSGLARLYFQAVDGHDQSEIKLKQNLVAMIRQILNGEGKIHFSAGACRNRDEVFSSAQPSYLRPPLPATP